MFTKKLSLRLISACAIAVATLMTVTRAAAQNESPSGGGAVFEVTL